MKITQEQLKQIIAEELDAFLDENINSESFKVRLYHHTIGTWILSSVEEAIEMAKQQGEQKNIPFEEFSIEFNARGDNPMYPNSSVLKNVKMGEDTPEKVKEAGARVYYTKAAAKKAGAWKKPFRPIKKKKTFYGYDQSDFGGYGHSSRNWEE